MRALLKKLRNFVNINQGYILILGAKSQIGKALARIYALNGFNLEIIRQESI